ETPSDDPAVPEEFLDLIRMRTRTDVEVLRPASEQQVADTATNEVRRVVMFVQPIQHLERVRIDLFARQRVIGPRNDDRRRHGFAAFQFGPTPTSTVRGTSRGKACSIVSRTRPATV